MVKETKEDSLNLEEAVVKETKDSSCKDKQVKTDLDPKIGEKGNMKNASETKTLNENGVEA